MLLVAAAVLSGKWAYASDMTLVISVSTPAYALHVSDRLVSKGGRPHDPLANKTVVVRASDGLLVIGYTGLAFCDGRTTDSWIANVITNDELIDEPRALMGFGAFSVRDVGLTLTSLANRIRADAMFRRHGLQLAATGWQWDKRRRRRPMRNVLWCTQNHASTVQWQQLVPRYPPERTTTFKLNMLGDWPLAKRDAVELLDEVRQAGTDWRHAEQQVIGAIRRCSARKPGTIGPHCMSVALPASGPAFAEIRFAPAEVHHAVVLDQAVETAYSPWVIAPDGVVAPSIIVGDGWHFRTGPLTVRIRGPAVPDEQQLRAGVSLQARPRT